MTASLPSLQEEKIYFMEIGDPQIWSNNYDDQNDDEDDVDDNENINSENDNN